MMRMVIKVLSDRWYENNDADIIWWKDTPETIGIWIFSFDKKTEFNMFSDYPWKLTKDVRRWRN